MYVYVDGNDGKIVCQDISECFIQNAGSNPLSRYTRKVIDELVLCACVQTRWTCLFRVTHDRPDL